VGSGITVSAKQLIAGYTMSGACYVYFKSPAPVLPGDANGDRVVNCLDVSKAERIISGLD
jgi:hypothetical protein